MFHQFHVAVEDRDYLRFLWWDKGDTSTRAQEYRMNVHLFGAASSPCCANFALKHLSKMYENLYPEAAKFLQQNFYVDDGITSVDSASEAVSLIKEMRDLCSQGGLHLHKFVSNNHTVLESISVEDRAIEMQTVDLSKDEVPVERTLGMQWCVGTDTFTFQFQGKDQLNTRRGILSTVASVYDPLGLISPFVLEGKSILQEMCKRGVQWDDFISGYLQPRWERWKLDLQNLKEIHISRCYKPAELGPVISTELHRFSDASTGGYRVCSYLRLICDAHVHCCLIASKARVSPTKMVTIPRLELTAAVVVVKMSCKVKEDIYAQRRWCRIQYLLEQCWCRWKSEYLINICERQKWNKTRRNVCVGNIVLLIETEVPRMEWPMGKVVEVQKDADELVRRVKVQLSVKSDRGIKSQKQPSVLGRPIQKLVVLLQAD